ncbi:MAG: hypothetical protein E7256_16770 [Lachnospiraceae bacterium]|nr:hypothetical protein [Lachnospiraceae bacterium]
MGKTIERMKEQCGSPWAYAKGYEIYQEGKIVSFRQRELEQGLLQISAMVKASEPNKQYDVELILDEETKDLVDYSCECPAYASYDGPCKHCIAIGLWYEEAENKEDHRIESTFTVRQQESKAVPSKTGGREPAKVQYYHTSEIARKLITEYTYKKSMEKGKSDTGGGIELEPVLSFQYNGMEVSFRVGDKRLYSIKDLLEFTDAVKHHTNIAYGKQLEFVHMPAMFAEKSHGLLSFIIDCVQEMVYENPYEYTYTALRRKIPSIHLNPQRLERLMGIMTGRKITLKGMYRSELTLFVERQDVILDMNVRKLAEGAFEFSIPEITAFMGTNHMYIMQGSHIYECSTEYTRHMGDFWQLLEKNGREYHFTITKEYMPAFLSNVIPMIKDYIQVEEVEEVCSDYIPPKGEIRYYIDSERGEVYVTSCARYGEKEYNILESVQTSSSYRDTELERDALAAVSFYFKEKDMVRQTMTLEDSDEAFYRLMTEGIRKLNQIGEVFLAEHLKRIQIRKNTKVSVGVALKSNLLELNIASGDIPNEELIPILQSYKKKKKFYRLKNGDFLKLEDNALSSLSELADGLNLSEKEMAAGTVKVPKYRAFYLDKVLRDEETLHLKRDTAFRNLLRNMKMLEDGDFEVPEELQDVLRNYQKTGYQWLRTLEMLGFGGILADDMGLGKTVQIIALLLSRYKEEKDSDPSIIICPASLVYNWQREIERFAPFLKTIVMTGSVAERQQKLKDSKKHVIITSYDLLKRDIEAYEKIKFHYIILDEAQAIKNQTTLAAKAVKRLDAVSRFALSGTPIENRLSELWSIFDFLMPDFLYSYAKFRKEYESAIVTNQDEKISRRLKRMIKPFILRRLKEDVLKELPDKLETDIISKMEGEQSELYKATKAALIKSLRSQSKEEFNHGRIKMLAELTKLRQICCDPSLVYDGYKGPSAKLETCMELVHHAMESGHKVLIFSQFTSMLSILAARLQKEKIDYHMLVGATAKEKRMQLVNAFQKDDTPVFLISLKAGGTGLNLTAANIVIHYDPWWNVAVQNQATDRAYRMGQEENVTVYKLITKDTLEEKILSLQAKKQALSDQIISQDGVSISTLSQEDFLDILGGI